MKKMMTYNRIKFFLLLLVFQFALLTHGQVAKLERPSIKTIVIDAGHGGKDPGCHGASANEKTVCLNIALLLGEMIKNQFPQMKVVYTRDKDVFVELDERANIANKAKADLFICIHANSASPNAYGAETYVLGLHRTDSQQKVAERENATIYLEEDKGEKYKDFDLSPDALIARQIQLKVFLDQSISFADKLQKEFKSIGRYNRGVKQAGFLVLYKTTMPSVLIETGFLTNPAEDKFLADAEGQKKMANAMFVAFQNYKNELEGVDLRIVSNSSKSTAPKNETQKDLVNTGFSAENPVPDEWKDKVIFMVQIETSDVKIETSHPKFKGMKVSEYQQDKLFKYTTGIFINDFKAANNWKNDLRINGFEHAFLVAFLNGERINLEKAIKLAKN
jgi:N-acetylmuramoyl-L-alanine amidase